jgi:endoglucanase
MLASSPSDDVAVGDVGTWALPPAEIDSEGILHTAACDDLAALAAAISAYDALLSIALRGDPVEDVRLLFTRAEEIGFIGAIAACRLGTMPKDARVIALENSRAFAESPIGGGPIVRVGDRMSIFTPQLTAACAKRAEEITAAPASQLATQRNADVKGSAGRWQRKLMAGGACEATVFCAYGYAATCLCLPLGNYHNMTDIDRVQSGKAKRGRLGSEFVSMHDFESLVRMLQIAAAGLHDTDGWKRSSMKLMDRLHRSGRSLLKPRRGAR